MSNNNYNKGPFESTLDRIQKRLPKEYKKPTLKDKAVRKPALEDIEILKYG